MYFKECVTSEAEWGSYEELLAKLSAFLDDCIRHLVKALRAAEEAAAKERRPHHATVMLFGRHVCEFIDGVSVLAGKGIAEPCKPLLRSAFEALISICYILAKDTERRALAYQVVHAHKRIRLYRKMMLTEQAGREFRQTMQSDPIGSTISLPALDYRKMINNLNKLFLRPEFASIEQAWNAAKKKTRGSPQWFSLFGGPSTISALATDVGFAAWYEIVYRQWSEAVHAGGVMGNVSRARDGRTVLRPLRHPEGLQTAVSLAANMCVSLARRLVAHYVPKRQPEFKSAYVRNLRQQFLELSRRERIINAPWR